MRRNRRGVILRCGSHRLESQARHDGADTRRKKHEGACPEQKHRYVRSIQCRPWDHDEGFPALGHPMPGDVSDQCGEDDGTGATGEGVPHDQS
jgi:hypothetical protein